MTFFNDFKSTQDGVFNSEDESKKVDFSGISSIFDNGLKSLNPNPEKEEQIVPNPKKHSVNVMNVIQKIISSPFDLPQLHAISDAEVYNDTLILTLNNACDEEFFKMPITESHMRDVLFKMGNIKIRDVITYVKRNNNPVDSESSSPIYKTVSNNSDIKNNDENLSELIANIASTVQEMQDLEAQMVENFKNAEGISTIEQFKPSSSNNTRFVDNINNIKFSGRLDKQEEEGYQTKNKEDTNTTEEKHHHSNTPRIYAYTIPAYRDTLWTGQKQGKGLIKIGFTTRDDVHRRIKEQFTAGTISNDYTLLLNEVAIDTEGEVFDDHKVHKVLERHGFKRFQGKEWFECGLKDVIAAIREVKYGVSFNQGHKDTFPMRPEQAEAVNLTAKYFEEQDKLRSDNKGKHFLWNAKMRFGKTFTTYQLAKRMNWQRVMILTYKPAVEGAWIDDLQNHIDFEGWQLVNKENRYENIDPTRPVIWFASFQDILHPDKNGKTKEKFLEAKKIDWDCVVIDEYHYGAWNENSKSLYDSREDAEESEINKEYEANAEFDEDSFPLKHVKHYLYLTGTPFRALGEGEFSENQIFNWTYVDEQRAKKEWGNKPNNPYLSLPEIQMLTYQLPEEVRKIAENGQNEFDLNTFFKAKSFINSSGEEEFIFEFENEVQKWLDIIRGNASPYSNSTQYTRLDNLQLPFHSTGLYSRLNHTFWLFNSVASCKAMERLLKQPQNQFWHQYDVILAAGSESGIGSKVVDMVKRRIGNGLNNKTITLSCGKLTTGVSISPWMGILFLSNIQSAESYFQAAFRVQTPWVIKNPEDETKKKILKNECFIFDFSPNRALNLLSKYSIGLSTDTHITREAKISEFLDFLPVLCFDGATMKPLNAGEILDFVSIGQAGSMLARKWQSAQLIDTTNITLERLLDNPHLIDAIHSIEGYSNIKEEVQKVISTDKSIKEFKQESPGEKLPRELNEKEKERKDFKKELRKKLLQFITKVPVFMYLTDFREESLVDVVNKLEPDLFFKVTGLTKEDFNGMCDVGVFNKPNLDDAIWSFRAYERASLSYLDSNPNLEVSMEEIRSKPASGL